MDIPASELNGLPCESKVYLLFNSQSTVVIDWIFMLKNIYKTEDVLLWQTIDPIFSFQVAEEIWICENQTITKWKGDIISYKTELKKKVMKQAKKNAAWMDYPGSKYPNLHLMSVTERL